MSPFTLFKRILSNNRHRAQVVTALFRLLFDLLNIENTKHKTNESRTVNKVRIRPSLFTISVVNCILRTGALPPNFTVAVI